VSGQQFGPHGSVSVDMLKPGEMTDVSVEMTSPLETGIHQGQWRMSTAAGLYFGGKLPSYCFVIAHLLSFWRIKLLNILLFIVGVHWVGNFARY